MSSSNCCFLTCIRVSQEAGQVVWYSQLLQNFPQFIVIHAVEGFGVVNKAEIQGKLEVVKQEMARVDIDILGVSELKWTGWVNLMQITNMSTSVGKSPLEEME